MRTEVLDILNRDLTEKVFSTPWALGTTFPLILAFMDVSASWAQNDWEGVWWHHPWVALLVEGLVIWLLFIPANKDFMILLLRVGRHRPRSTCLELFKNLLVLGTVAIPVAVLIASYGLTRFADVVVFDSANAMLRAAGFACCTLLIAVCNFLLGLRLKLLLRRGW